MPYFEMWWGSTDIPSSEGTTSLFGPAGVTVQGNVASGSHKITGHFFASPDRLGRAGIANVRCASGTATSFARPASHAFSAAAHAAVISSGFRAVSSGEPSTG